MVPRKWHSGRSSEKEKEVGTTTAMRRRTPLRRLARQILIWNATPAGMAVCAGTQSSVRLLWEEKTANSVESSVSHASAVSAGVGADGVNAAGIKRRGVWTKARRCSTATLAALRGVAEPQAFCLLRLPEPKTTTRPVSCSFSGGDSATRCSASANSGIPLTTKGRE